ncbi:hypothetical protein [Undibacterium squillarum]|uniref:Uncharacterized protein n=1 Tax=Undibacterium squillarum TaxID=1131567 RepID=A0ABQ2XYW5_9BURK|nr:hypothetical protein [Undibacterium squillarum]GGX41498.1 hypothetical protein GCM10010946_20020 [Undibacterium squillarum]
MQRYVFASPVTLNKEAFNSVATLENVCNEFFDVSLSGTRELELLFELLGVADVAEESLPDSEDFNSVIDLSTSKLPEFSTEEFDVFYGEWLARSGRESDMDEYGQLIFLQGYAKKWNKNLHIVVLCLKPLL